MEHRHLTDDRLSLAAIDDIIVRGGRGDWQALHVAASADPALLDGIRRVCLPNVGDPYAQRYHFWLRYAQEYQSQRRTA